MVVYLESKSPHDLVKLINQLDNKREYKNSTLISIDYITYKSYSGCMYFGAYLLID